MKRAPDWSKDEINFLKVNYLKLNYRDLMKALNRSYKSVNTRISILKLYPKKLQENEPFPNLSETNKAYIVGLIDGEGTIGIFITYRNKVPIRARPTLKIGLTHKPVLKWIAKKIDEAKLSPNPCSVRTLSREKEPRRKIVYSIDLANRPQIESLVRVILPYLRIRREIADKILEFYKLRHWGKAPSIQDWKRVLATKNLISSSTLSHIRSRQRLAQFIKELERKEQNQ